MDLYFKDGSRHRARDVEIEEGMTRLVINEGDGSYSVVPLVNLKYYDVAPAGEL